MTAGEQLQHYLERFFALRQHGDDAIFVARLRRLQDWQGKRLRHTHAHLLNDPVTAEGIRFLLDEVYGGRELLPVARGIRRRQLQLVAELGHRLDRYIRSRMLHATFRMVRKPAHAAGFANLYDFMDRSFRVMKPVPSVGLLLEQLAAREDAIMEKVFACHPSPFEN